MLDTKTKRRIDTARDILVGKVPDPKSQVEQITIALIYKFMWDIDAQSEELGGERSFFVGEFDRYGWPRLMHAGLGGHDTLNLYGEALDRIPENPGIPSLFRGIFNNAYLPYRDPETLRAFLKVIDEFEYDHSERLGDAFEYLLSVMGAQGDAGQFRTPRHIIDFIVAVVDPQKHETVLDPACGTAGFLISSYKHILAANVDENGQSTLTPDERGRLADNFMGYDISPDMVRLSLVNLYLHGFADPRIHEYDTLTNDERWSHHADVILANPPFMSPKGGIRPHNRFSITSKRSEVLFVDYMAEHLTPAGRAGIIVPEGIIFQSQKAHTRLRQMLVEDSLVAVVSLPAGIFKPYSGVKTSILILDRALARRADHIAFFKVENDGFDLGDQRRPIDRNDLPRVLAELTEYLRRVRAGESLDDFEPSLGLVVTKNTITAGGDFSLTGERYQQSVRHSDLKWPLVELRDVAIVDWGNTKLTKRSYVDDGEYLGVSASGCDGRMVHAEHDIGTLVLSAIGANCGRMFLPDKQFTAIKNTITINPIREKFHPLFALALLSSTNFSRRGGGQPFITKGDVLRTQIPLPPPRVQKEMAAEIEGYQRVIDGARAVIDNYRPHIPIDPNWPLVSLGEACEINPDKVNPALAYPDQTIHYVDISSVENGTGRLLGYTEVSSYSAPVRARRGVRNDDVLLSTVRPNLRAFALLKTVKERTVASTGFAVLRVRPGIADPAFIHSLVCSDYAVRQMVIMMGKGSYPSINQADVATIQVPLPPVAVQRSIAGDLETEQTLVTANRELIDRFDGKVKAVISRIWADAATPAAA